MKIRLLTFLLSLCLPLVCHAQQPQDNLPEPVQLARLGISVIGGGVPAPVVECTSPTGAIMWEGFEESDREGDCADGYESSCRYTDKWTIVGSTPDFNATSPAGSPANTACSTSVRLNYADGNESIYWDYGSNWAAADVATTVTAWIYIASATLPNNTGRNIFHVNSSTGAWYRGHVRLYHNNSGNYAFLFQNTYTAKEDYTLPGWFKFKLHFAADSTESYLQINDDEIVAATTEDRVARYIYFGTIVSMAAGDALDMYLGSVYVD